MFNARQPHRVVFAGVANSRYINISTLLHARRTNMCENGIKIWQAQREGVQSGEELKGGGGGWAALMAI